MTFTYDPAKLQERLLFRVRLQLGDTEEGKGVKPEGGNLQDEELEALIAEAGNDFNTAMARACGLLATHWARYADVSAGKVREAAGQVSKRYLELASVYEKKAAMGGASEFAGGVGGSIFAGVVADWEADAQVETAQGMTSGSEYGE